MHNIFPMVLLDCQSSQSANCRNRKQNGNKRLKYDFWPLNNLYLML